MEGGRSRRSRRWRRNEKIKLARNAVVELQNLRGMAQQVPAEVVRSSSAPGHTEQDSKEDVAAPAADASDVDRRGRRGPARSARCLKRQALREEAPSHQRIVGCGSAGIDPRFWLHPVYQGCAELRGKRTGTGGPWTEVQPFRKLDGVPRGVG